MADSQDTNEVNIQSPKKSLRETFSGNSIHSVKVSESDIQDENNEESENENNTNLMNDNTTLTTNNNPEQFTKTTGLPRLTRSRSGKIGKSTR